MNRTEHLLTILAEECAEVAQRASKALRFTANEVQPGQDQTNAQRIAHEMVDLVAVFEMLVVDGVIEQPPDVVDLMRAKTMKVEHFLKYSAERGTLC